MPLPNRRFLLMHHHEIEQVLRKQLSHMMLPDPLSADFYCGVTSARAGKPWAGFGVPGLNHVFVAKSSKYPKHVDGSPILPPGTLGKTAGFVSVHAPKSMISISRSRSRRKGGGVGMPEDHNLSDIEEEEETVNATKARTAGTVPSSSSAATTTTVTTSRTTTAKPKTESVEVDERREILEHRFDEEVIEKKVNWKAMGDRDERLRRISSRSTGRGTGTSTEKQQQRDHGDEGGGTPKGIASLIERGYDLLMAFERCNATIFYVHQQCEGRMVYDTANGLIQSRWPQRDDAGLFTLCLGAREKAMNDLVAFLDVTDPDTTFYPLLAVDKGRKLIYRVMLLFGADDAVFVAMLKLIAAKIYIVATVQRGHRLSDPDIHFPNKLKAALYPPTHRVYRNRSQLLSKHYAAKKRIYDDLRRKMKEQTANDQRDAVVPSASGSVVHSKSKSTVTNSSTKTAEIKVIVNEDGGDGDDDDDDRKEKEGDDAVAVPVPVDRGTVSSDLEAMKEELIRIENQMDYLRQMTPPRLSSANALVILSLILRNLRSFRNVEDRRLLLKSRLVCCVLSVVIKVSRPNEAQWIEANQQLLALFNNDLTFLVPTLSTLQPKSRRRNGTVHGTVPSTTTSSSSSSTSTSTSSSSSSTKHNVTGNGHNKNSHRQSAAHRHSVHIHSQRRVPWLEQKVRGHHLVIWTALLSSYRIRWEVVCDLVTGCDAGTRQKVHSLPLFWQSVRSAMMQYTAARVLAMQHEPLRSEFVAHFNRLKERARAQISQLRGGDMVRTLNRAHSPLTDGNTNESTPSSQSRGSPHRSASPQEMQRAQSEPMGSPQRVSPIAMTRAVSDGAVPESSPLSISKDPLPPQREETLTPKPLPIPPPVAAPLPVTAPPMASGSPQRVPFGPMMMSHVPGGNMPFHPDPYLPAQTQSMHHYVAAMRVWLAAFRRNELKQMEKEREHQLNRQKQIKRQREYEQLLQRQRDRINERFKKQFFKQLEAKKKLMHSDTESIKTKPAPLPKRKEQTVPKEKTVTKKENVNEHKMNLKPVPDTKPPEKTKQKVVGSKVETKSMEKSTSKTTANKSATPRPPPRPSPSPSPSTKKKDRATVSATTTSTSTTTTRISAVPARSVKTGPPTVPMSTARATVKWKKKTESTSSSVVDEDKKMKNGTTRHCVTANGQHLDSQSASKSAANRTAFSNPKRTKKMWTVRPRAAPSSESKSQSKSMANSKSKSMENVVIGHSLNAKDSLKNGHSAKSRSRCGVSLNGKSSNSTPTGSFRLKRMDSFDLNLAPNPNLIRNGNRNEIVERIGPRHGPRHRIDDLDRYRHRDRDRLRHRNRVHRGYPMDRMPRHRGPRMLWSSPLNAKGLCLPLDPNCDLLVRARWDSMILDAISVRTHSQQNTPSALSAHCSVDGAAPSKLSNGVVIGDNGDDDLDVDDSASSTSSTSSCSADTARFVSLFGGIGVDPFDLNRRYFRDLMVDSESISRSKGASDQLIDENMASNPLDLFPLNADHRLIDEHRRQELDRHRHSNWNRYRQSHRRRDVNRHDLGRDRPYRGGVRPNLSGPHDRHQHVDGEYDAINDSISGIRSMSDGDRKWSDRRKHSNSYYDSSVALHEMRGDLRSHIHPDRRSDVLHHPKHSNKASPRSGGPKYTKNRNNNRNRNGNGRTSSYHQPERHRDAHHRYDREQRDRYRNRDGHIREELGHHHKTGTLRQTEHQSHYKNGYGASSAPKQYSFSRKMRR